MRNKLLAIILSIAVAVTFVPTFAFATVDAGHHDNIKASAKHHGKEMLHRVGTDDEDEDWDDDYDYDYDDDLASIDVMTEFYDEEYDDTYDAWASIYSEGTEEPVSEIEGIQYDDETNTLTLDSYNGGNIFIYNMAKYGEMDIVVKNENYIETTAEDDAAIFISNYGVPECHGVNFKGEGTINIYAHGSEYAVGIESDCSSLDFACGGINIVSNVGKSKYNNMFEYGVKASTDTYYDAYYGEDDELYFGNSNERDIVVNFNCPMNITCKHTNVKKRSVAAVSAKSYLTDDIDDPGSDAIVTIDNHFKAAKLNGTTKAYAPRKSKAKYTSTWYDKADKKRYTYKYYTIDYVLGTSGAAGKYYGKTVETKKAKDKKKDWFSSDYRYNSKTATKLSIIPNNSVADMLNMSFDNSDETYDGSPIKPMMVIDGLNEGSDFIVEFSNNVNVGEAKAVVKGIGDFTGSKTYTFKILPVGTKITNISKGSTSMTVEWDAQLEPMSEKTIDGYVIKYSTNESMSKAKKVTVKGASKVKTTIKKLKKNKDYFVTIQTYKKVGKKTYYSVPGDIEETAAYMGF